MVPKRQETVPKSVNLGRKKPDCEHLPMRAGRASPNQTGSVVCVTRPDPQRGSGF